MHFESDASYNQEVGSSPLQHRTFFPPSYAEIPKLSRSNESSFLWLVLSLDSASFQSKIFSWSSRISTTAQESMRTAGVVLISGLDQNSVLRLLWKNGAVQEAILSDGWEDD